MEIEDLRKKLDSKELSAPELTRFLIEKIKKEDKELNSFITISEEEALIAAASAQKLIDKGEGGELCGIPITLKDNICTKGIKTTAASRMLENFLPQYDAYAAKRLKDAGAVILGKTNMDEFAIGSNSDTSYFGSVKNPLNREMSPGGSSGGAAAGICAGFAAAALGSDTGGSVRLPASFCGVCGIKPTYGRVSRFGLIAFASSFDQIGVIASSAKDTGYVLNCICGYDMHDSTSAKRSFEDFCGMCGKSLCGLKIALPKEFFSDGVSDEIKEAVFSAVKFFENNGAILKSVSMPSIDLAVSAYYIMSSAEAASNLSRYDGIKYGYRSSKGETYEEIIENTRREGFGDEVKRRILLGNFALSSGYYDEYYKNAARVRNNIKEEYDKIFEEADIVISPTSCAAVPHILKKRSLKEIYSDDRCTVPANMAGLPSITVNCGYSKNGMPIGMSITGKSFCEAEIIAVADAFLRGYAI